MASTIIDSSIIPFDPARMRRTVLEMAYAGSTVHIACAFSIIELLTVLYRHHLRYPGNDPRAEGRDYLVLSKGHGVMALYACLREIGLLPQADLDAYFSDGSRLHGLCEWKVPGCEVSSGSLGHGLPVAVGIALGLARRGRCGQRVCCIAGDGEMNEGTMWESMLFAAHHRLENLVVIVDANGFQAMDATSRVVGLEPLVEKFRAFGFVAVECDGHDTVALARVLRFVMTDCREQKPRAVIARTVKGKGVSFMEGNNAWHYLRLDAAAVTRALHELEVDDA
jgi:transketolase